jgi:hypothetical protein
MSTEQDLKNERHKAERDFAFAEPGSGKEKMAKIRFENATRMLLKRRKKAQSTDDANK